MLHTIKCFTSVKSVPSKLASLIGFEEAGLLYEIIQCGRIASVFWKPKTIDRLLLLGLVIIHKLPDEYLVHYDRLEEILTPKEFKLPEIKPTFTDGRFTDLCIQWNEILKSKSRSKTFKEIYLLFENKTLEESIAALQYAVNNRHVTLHFKDENIKTTSSGTGSSGRIGRAGGSKNTDTGTTDHEKLSRKLE